jgi:hypothetical protein
MKKSLAFTSHGIRKAAGALQSVCQFAIRGVSAREAYNLLAVAYFFRAEPFVAESSPLLRTYRILVARVRDSNAGLVCGLRLRGFPNVYAANGFSSAVGPYTDGT